MIGRIIALIAFTYLISCRDHCDAVEDVKKKPVSGTVIKKYVLDWNHRSKELDITSNSSKKIHIYLYAEKSGFWNYVNVGDSIYKGTDSFEVLVYRNKNPKKFILNYGGCH